MWKYFEYYKSNHPKARTFSFARKITEKLFNRNGTPKMTKGGRQSTKSRNRKFDEITKDDMLYGVLSLNDLLPIDSRSYSTQKKKWGEFGVFLARLNNLENMNYKNAVVEYKIFSETKANKDIDNLVGASKVINDGLFVQSGMFKDDNYTLINPFIGSAEYNKEYPHTEIRISLIDEKIKDIYSKMQIHIDNFK